jgi:hypothetical protein
MLPRHEPAARQKTRPCRGSAAEKADGMLRVHQAEVMNRIITERPQRRGADQCRAIHARLVRLESTTLGWTP